jgi:hypothetical protein
MCIIIGLNRLSKQAKKYFSIILLSHYSLYIIFFMLLFVHFAHDYNIHLSILRWTYPLHNLYNLS